MEILGIGPLELIVILIVALAVFGPDKLPEIGAKLGRGMREMRRATREFSREIEAVRDIADEVKQPITDAAAPFLDAAQAAGTIGQAISNPTNLIRDSVLREMNRQDPPAKGEDAVVVDQAAPSPAADDLPVAAEAAAFSAANPSAPSADDLPAAAEAAAVSAADQGTPEPAADDLPPTVEALVTSAEGEAPPPTSED